MKPRCWISLVAALTLVLVQSAMAYAQHEMGGATAYSADSSAGAGAPAVRAPDPAKVSGHGHAAMVGSHDGDAPCTSYGEESSDQNCCALPAGQCAMACSVAVGDLEGLSPPAYARAQPALDSDDPAAVIRGTPTPPPDALA